MKDSKFVILFKTLSQAEEKVFYKHLKQLHGDKEAFHLYEYLRKLHPELEEDKNLSIEYAFKAIHRESIDAHHGNRKNMQNHLYELHKWLKEYLLAQRTRPDTWEGQVLWLDILFRRKLHKEFSKEALHFCNETENTPKESIDDYFKAIIAGYFQYHLLTADSSAPLEVLQNPIDNIEKYGETIRLKLACEVLNRTLVLPSAGQPTEEASPKKQVVPSAKFPDQNLLALYRELYVLLKTPSDAQFERLEALFRKTGKHIAASEWQHIFNYMYNYAAIQFRRGQEAVYAEKLHNLNQTGLKHNLFPQQGLFSPSFFNNIVTVACTAGKMDWARTFIRQNGRFLEAAERADTLLVAEAIVDFEETRFEKVINALQNLEAKDLVERIRIRSLLLRSYYETDEDFGLIQTYCASFEQMLRRQSQSPAHYVTAAQSFISVFKMLLMRNVDKQKLLNRIKGDNNLSLRLWLEKKAATYQPLKSSKRPKK